MALLNVTVTRRDINVTVIPRRGMLFVTKYL